MSDKSTKLEHSKRIETVRQLIISGMDSGRIVPNIAEQWKLKERQARNYVALARAQIEQIGLEARPYLIAEHISVRRSIRERARQAKDLRAELAAAQDEAKLFGLYPSEKIEVMDWRKELESNGIDAGTTFDALVAAIAASTKPDDACGGSGGKAPTGSS